MALAPGDLIAQKYRIVRKLGEGAMGVVYAGVHELLKTQVALKFLHKDLAERPGLGVRFLQEAQVAARIRSPHVAAVWDADTWHGMPFLVMEFLPGETLRKLLDRERKLSLANTVDFAAQILLGLEAAHALSVVHRDLKPDNVFVTQEREGVVLKLIDFGIAKLRQPDQGSPGLTEAGMILGTPEYMAPEQVVEAAKVDHRADVYSVGAMLYEMLSGHTVVERSSLEATLIAVQMGQIRPLSELDPSLPKSLEAIVMRALSRDREQRFPSAFAFRQALAPFAADQSYAGERALAAPAIALGTQPMKAVSVSDAPFADPVAPAPGATVRVAPTVIEEQIARASTFPAPRVALPDAPPAPGYPSPPFVQQAEVPGYAPARTERNPKRSKAPVIILGTLALALGVAIGVVIFIQSGSSSDSTISLPQSSEATTSFPEVVHPELTKPEAPTPSPTYPAPYPGPGRPRPTTPPSAGPTGAKPDASPPLADAGDGQSTADAGTPPLTFPLPSGLPSGFPTAITIPTALPSSFPTALPPFPGFPQPAPQSPPADAGQPLAP